jgi:hypothetical protein
LVKKFSSGLGLYFSNHSASIPPQLFSTAILIHSFGVNPLFCISFLIELKAVSLLVSFFFFLTCSHSNTILVSIPNSSKAVLKLKTISSCRFVSCIVVSCISILLMLSPVLCIVLSSCFVVCFINALSSALSSALKLFDRAIILDEY